MRSRRRALGGAAAALRGRVRHALSARRHPPAGSAPPPEPEPAQEALDPDEPPELPEEEVRGLRDDLRRELDKLARADIKASRTRSERASPPG